MAAAGLAAWPMYGPSDRALAVLTRFPRICARGIHHLGLLGHYGPVHGSSENLRRAKDRDGRQTAVVALPRPPRGGGPTGRVSQPPSNQSGLRLSQSPSTNAVCQLNNRRRGTQ
jgi:hypothetical protein